jgi:hypothetical protein
LILKLEKEILRYIKEHPRCSKTDVILHMENNKLLSAPVTLKKIKNLVEGGKIIVKADKVNSQKHLLIINDKNDFNILVAEISDIQTRCDKLKRVVSFRFYIKNKKGSQTFDSFTQDYLNFINFTQLYSYIEITSIATRIDKNIKLEEDREVLYLQLTEVLNTSNKLNKIIKPEIQNFLEQMIEQIEGPDLMRNRMVANLVREVSNLFVRKK